MTITELIAALEALRAEHGDVKVQVHASNVLLRDPAVRLVEDIPICGDGCCHADEVWL